MAKKKADLIAEAQAAGLDVGDSNTVAEIKEALKEAETQPTPEETLKAKKAEAKQAKKTPKDDDAGAKETEKDPSSEATKTEDEASARKAAAQKREQQRRRSRLERAGKQYRNAHTLVEKGKEYNLEEAVVLLAKTSYAKFDAAVEMHINLGIDPKQADQAVRGTVTLPHGNGKTQRIAVYASEADQKKAKTAGADVVGNEQLAKQIKQEQFDFDILVATPDVMSELGKFAKILGPKGLMPNPKSGTVTQDIAQTVKELKSGRVEFRNDPTGIVHQVIGRVSFDSSHLRENAVALLRTIHQAKPSGVKVTYIQKIWLTTSMGPSIKLDVNEALKAI